MTTWHFVGWVLDSVLANAAIGMIFYSIGRQRGESIGYDEGQDFGADMGFIRGYFAGWSDKRKGRSYGSTTRQQAEEDHQRYIASARPS